jgi:type I restriction enzyme R subunit
MQLGPSNFAFLRPHDIQLVRLGALAERYFHDDPNTCLIKLRQFGELLAQLIAGKTGQLQPGEESQADVLRRLKFERLLPPKSPIFSMRSASLEIAPVTEPAARPPKP